MIKRTTLMLMLSAALFAAGCGDDEEAATGGDPTTTQSAPREDASNLDEKPTVKPPQGAPPKQLVKNDLVEGTGAEAKSGDEVTVHYVGVDYKTGSEFDSSWSRNEPFVLPLGAGRVIRGWDLGLQGMKEGGRRELIIPPNLAYGSAGAPPTIGPNETLIFVVDLVAVK